MEMPPDEAPDLNYFPISRSTTAVCVVLALFLSACGKTQEDAYRSDASLEADMLVSGGNTVEVWINDWQHPSERLPVVAGQRQTYQFGRIPRDIHMIRFDPTDVPGARIVIYSLTLKIGDQTLRRFGPSELKRWELHNVSTPEERDGGLQMQDTSDDPILLSNVNLQLPADNRSRFVLWGPWLAVLAVAGGLYVLARKSQALDRRKRRWLVLIGVWMLTAIAILPALYHWAAPRPYSGSAAYFPLAVGYLTAAAICVCIFGVERRSLTRPQAIILVFVVLLLTCLTNNLHWFTVDHGKNIFNSLSNAAWQSQMNDYAIQLYPGVAPHSYRFLPNAIVRWMQIAHLDFESARDLFRLLAGLLLFYSLYRYARLYCSYSGAVMAMLFTAAIYPVSFENYAGQLTDPLSHLSFVLALLFLETEEFALLLSTLLIGSLAKETVFAMAGYYVLFRRQEKGYPWKAAGLCVLSVATYFGVRFFVLHGGMGYQQTSGVGLDHVLDNWRDPDWRVPFLLTACALLPFLAVGWKETPVSLKRQALFLLPVLFISSLFFSWLREARNFMPLVFVTSVIAAGFLERQTTPTATD
jgi:hypothetical protein